MVVQMVMEEAESGSGHLVARDGVSLVCAEYGSGAPVLLLHGLAGYGR